MFTVIFFLRKHYYANCEIFYYQKYAGSYKTLNIMSRLSTKTYLLMIKLCIDKLYTIQANIATGHKVLILLLLVQNLDRGKFLQ